MPSHRRAGGRALEHAHREQRDAQLIAESREGLSALEDSMREVEA